MALHTEPMPGIYKISDFLEEVSSLYVKGLDEGVKIGWPSLDELYRIRLGEMTVVTGIPGHGKSEILDAVMVKLATVKGWKCLYFSPENYPIPRHYVKLAEKYIGKPFKTKYNCGGFTDKDLNESVKWITKHFTFLYPDDEHTTLDNILALAEEAIETNKIQCVVFDPWNEIEHKRPSSMSETEYVAFALGRIRRFARRLKVHFWIVAHPTKMQKNRDSGKYECPSPYDISGSANWRNKPDYCLAVYRPDPTINTVQIHVQKVKFKEMGKLGMCEMEYDYITGRIIDRYDDSPPY